MLNPKKMIPSLASACLALTGCGGSDGSLSEGVTNAIEDFCVKIAECYVGYTVQGCVEYYTTYIETYGDFSNPACEPALVSYVACLSVLSCEDFANSAEVCDEETQALDRECYSVE